MKITAQNSPKKKSLLLDNTLERVRDFISQFNSFTIVNFGIQSINQTNKSYPFPMYQPEIVPSKKRTYDHLTPVELNLEEEPRKRRAYEHEKKDTVTPRKKAPEDLTCRICWTKFPTANHWSLHTN